MTFGCCLEPLALVVGDVDVSIEWSGFGMVRGAGIGWVFCRSVFSDASSDTFTSCCRCSYSGSQVISHRLDFPPAAYPTF